MSEICLEAECQNCAALCCLSLAFDKSDKFGFDKANGEPCPNLGSCGDCTIHSQLQTKGFGGCVQYSCNGAGQLVTQDVFSGRSWQADESLRIPMMEAFQQMCRAQELLMLLQEARKLELGAAQTERIEFFENQLHPQFGWTASSLAKFFHGEVTSDVQKFLRSLKPFVKK